jgi:exonuclease SbcC
MRQGEGIRYETLFRDETVGALDAVNGKEYVRMLRRAMELGGFHQVIFICHTPLVWELADRVLSVAGGGVVMGDQQADSVG